MNQNKYNVKNVGNILLAPNEFYDLQNTILNYSTILTQAGFNFIHNNLYFKLHFNIKCER